jgi:hypothetical protein
VDTYSLRLNFTVPVIGIAQNVLHYNFTGSSSDSMRTVAESLVAGWVAHVWPKWKLCIANDCILASLSVRRVNDTGGPTYTILSDQVASGAAGTGVSAIALDIALAPASTPWQPGHIFLGPVPDGNISGNIWSPGFILAAQDICVALSNDLVGEPPISGIFKQVIWERKTKTSRTIAEWLIRAKPTTLNKRLTPYAA